MIYWRLLVIAATGVTLGMAAWRRTRRAGVLNGEVVSPTASRGALVIAGVMAAITYQTPQRRPRRNVIGPLRRLTALLGALIYRPTGAAAEEYHKWHYGTMLQFQTSWLGVKCYKSVNDIWNYQEILSELKPSLVVEFGTRHGGSALFFAGVMRLLGRPFAVLTVDITDKDVDPAVLHDPDVVFVKSSSTAPAVAAEIARLKSELPGRVFVILDSDHTMDHVLAEMKLLRPLLGAGDYLVVEDSNINGHPVAPGWGPGPYEAIEAYEREYPHDYEHDVAREKKFGWTYAPNGFLIRN